MVAGRMRDTTEIKTEMTLCCIYCSFHLNSSVKTPLQVTLLSTKKVVIVQIEYLIH